MAALNNDNSDPNQDIKLELSLDSYFDSTGNSKIEKWIIFFEYYFNKSDLGNQIQSMQNFLIQNSLSIKGFSKLNKKRYEEDEDYRAEKRLNFIKIIFRGLVPNYQQWVTDKGTMQVEKDAVTFQEFNDLITTATTAENSQEVKNILRGDTTYYSDKVKSNIEFKKFNTEKALLLYNLNLTYNGAYHVDHILSVAILESLSYSCSSEYSFDRYISIRSWINKCWNYCYIPQTDNSSQSSLERVISGRLLMSNNVKEAIKNVKSIPGSIEYFKRVALNMNKYAKFDFLSQMNDYKKHFVQFIEGVSDTKIDPESKEYLCGCCKKTKNYNLRISVYKYFITTIGDDKINSFVKIWRGKLTQHKLNHKKTARKKNNSDHKNRLKGK